MRIIGCIWRLSDKRMKTEKEFDFMEVPSLDKWDLKKLQKHVNGRKKNLKRLRIALMNQKIRFTRVKSDWATAAECGNSASSRVPGTFSPVTSEHYSEGSESLLTRKQNRLENVICCRKDNVWRHMEVATVVGLQVLGHHQHLNTAERVVRTHAHGRKSDLHYRSAANRGCMREYEGTCEIV